MTENEKQMLAALKTLVELHRDWSRGRASITVAFEQENKAAIAAALAAIKAAEAK